MSIVITGNPGVGKHTITKQIAKNLKLDIIDINQIAKDEKLFEKNEYTNDIDTTKLKKILKGRISEKNVIVGHLSIYKKRKYTDKKIIENTGSEVLGIIAYDVINKFQEKTFQINATKKSIQEIIDKVMKIISENRGNEEVDWLGLVTENNDLKKFFVD